MKLLFNVNVAWFFISHRLEIARAARDQGYDVHVSADLDSPEEAKLLESEGFRFHRIRLTRGGLSPTHDVSYLNRLREIMRSVNPVVVHNVTVKPVIYGTVAARSLGISRIVNAISGLGYAFSGGESRQMLAKFVRTAYRFALKRPHVRVIFQNSDDIETFVSAGIIEEAQAVLVRGSGVDLDAFTSAPEPAGAPVVVLPARMLRDKGVIEFADAARALLNGGMSAEFILAGMVDQANPASLSESDLLRLQGETGVRWLGQVSDMPALYRDSHIVCLPSYREGMPKSLLEACAAGRPIVTTDVPGCREVVRDGDNGLLVPPRDAGTLAAALAKLLRDPPLRMKMGAFGRRRAETEFDVRAVVRATLDVYQDMLA